MSSAEDKKKGKRTTKNSTPQPEAEAVEEGTLPSLAGKGAMAQTEESRGPAQFPPASALSEASLLEGKRLDVEARKLDIESAKLEIAKLTLEVEKLNMEERKQAMEMDNAREQARIAEYNRQASLNASSRSSEFVFPQSDTSRKEMRRSGKSSMTFEKLINEGVKQEFTQQEQKYYSRRDEPDSDEDSHHSGDDSKPYFEGHADSDSDSTDDEGPWTKVEGKKSSSKVKSVYANKAKSVFTTGEQSDWSRTKFVLNGPIDTLKMGKFIKELRKHSKGGSKGIWSLQDYKSSRKKVKEQDVALYKLLMESASSSKGETGSKRPKESTMSKAARTCEQGGTIPFGHGASFYLYIENLFENVKKTDPNFLLGACEDFRNSKMKEGQTPVEWREYLVDKWNECSGSVNETEFVTRFVMKLTNEYRHVIDAFSLRKPGDEWDIETAFTMANNFWNVRVKKKKGNSDKDQDRARRKQSKRDKKAAKADKEAGSSMYALQSTIHCDWCGEEGHMKNECTVETPL